MARTSEDSLIRLLDDPDPLVYRSVEKKILDLGPAMLPHLEEALKRTMNREAHQRMESIVRILQFEQVKNDLKEWLEGPRLDLLTGTWLIERYQFPDVSLDQYKARLKPLRDEIWLEINDQLTALEKVRIINTILFERHDIGLNNQHPESPGNNFISRILETGRANESSLTLLYSLICQELHLPVFVVRIPDYPILTWLNLPVLPANPINPSLFDSLFYINPANQGTVHSQNDITDYLMRKAIPIEPVFYMPAGNADFLRICLERLAMDYEAAGSNKRMEEIHRLLALWK